jgi:hypothetical protein
MKHSIIEFIKNRFFLVIIYMIIITKICDTNFKGFVFIILILTIALLLHSFLHECGHVIASNLLKIKVRKFSINRVYLEDEPCSPEEIKGSINKVKYGIIAVSGSVVTILCGYILLTCAHNLRQGMDLVSFLCWIFVLVIFLLGDCGYLIAGSISNRGDPAGVSAGLNIPRWIVLCSGIITLINIRLIWYCFWSVI